MGVCDLPQVPVLMKSRGCPEPGLLPPYPSPGVSRPIGSPKATLSLAGITEILMNRPSARNALGNVLVSQVRKGRHQGGAGVLGWGWAGGYLTRSPL